MGRFTGSLKEGYQLATYIDDDGKQYKVHFYYSTIQQSLGLAMSIGTGQSVRKDLSSAYLYPPGWSESSIKAKINCAFFDMKSPYKNYHGVWYYNGNVYFHDGLAIANPSTNNNLKSYIESVQHHPCVCIKNNTMSINWFGSLSNFNSKYKNFDFIFAGGHPLVYEGDIVFGSSKRSDTGNIIAPSSISTNDSARHYNPGIDAPTTAAMRTMIGQTSSKRYCLVCTDKSSKMTVAVGARLMKTLSCVYAVNLDGGGSTRMIVRENGAWNVKATDSENRPVATALCIR